MVTLGYTALQSIAYEVLTHYVRGPAMAQTIQERPLLRMLEANEKTFAGGGLNMTITENVQGNYLSDTPGTFQGFSQDDQIVFSESDNVLQSNFKWYEQSQALIITETDLKKSGVIVEDNMKTTKLSMAACDIVTDVLDNLMFDFWESWARGKNTMYWMDGSQDAKQTPGLLSLILDNGTNTNIKTGGITRGSGVRGSSSTWWWYNRSRVGALPYVTGTGLNTVNSPTGPKITPSTTDQTLTRTLRSEMRQLRRFGGRPTIALAGSSFIDALEYEAQQKGIYTQTGFDKGIDLSFGDISLKGVGNFVWDPTMDDLGLSKRCYIFDPKKIKLRPMEGCKDKVRKPTRPYNYYVHLTAVQNTCAMTASQLSGAGVYEVS